ncbi:MAG: hypothetical protein NXI30_02150 [bacterium]|nr:hypothetical protein [bacterium]
MQTDEKLLGVLATHSDQAMSLRAKMHSVTERTVATMLILAGWLVSSTESMPWGVRASLSIFALLAAYVASAMVRANNRSYLRVTGVVVRVNEALGLSELETPSGERVYPDSWHNTPNEPAWRSWWRHVAMIWATSLLVVAVIWWRSPAV